MDYQVTKSLARPVHDNSYLKIKFILIMSCCSIVY